MSNLSLEALVATYCGIPLVYNSVDLFFSVDPRVAIFSDKTITTPQIAFDKSMTSHG